MSLKRVARLINPKAVRRAQSMDESTLRSYLPSITMTLGATTDAWLYHNGPVGDVQLSLEAFNAVWTELEARTGSTPLVVNA